ncbi:hypothetical protein [Bacillus solitudinis]|uniref:hypothetical protein n=1 Tax=Bacillus solitudinis TaxID=2014074 RepID=UPI000C231567|nr:hypothetical protein [Bacillus solitudinis]
MAGESQDQARSLRKQMKQFKKEESIKKVSLPPRGEYHRNRRSKRMKVKITFPVIRLLLMLFLLLVILAVTSPSWLN